MYPLSIRTLHRVYMCNATRSRFDLFACPPDCLPACTSCITESAALHMYTYTRIYRCHLHTNRDTLLTGKHVHDVHITCARAGVVKHNLLNTNPNAPRPLRRSLPLPLSPPPIRFTTPRSLSPFFSLLRRRARVRTTRVALFALPICNFCIRAQ